MNRESYQKKRVGGIIVDGADQMGKTTLCEKLAQELNMEIIHFGIPKGVVDQHNHYTEPVRRDGGPFIVDRNYVSEMVYGPIFRGGSKVTSEIQAKIEQTWTEANYFLVICVRQDYKWEDREEYYTEEDNLKVIDGFIRVIPRIGMDHLVVDPFKEDAPTIVSRHYRKKNWMV